MYFYIDIHGYMNMRFWEICIPSEGINKSSKVHGPSLKDYSSSYHSIHSFLFIFQLDFIYWSMPVISTDFFYRYMSFFSLVTLMASWRLSRQGFRWVAYSSCRSIAFCTSFYLSVKSVCCLQLGVCNDSLLGVLDMLEAWESIIFQHNWYYTRLLLMCTLLRLPIRNFICQFPAPICRLVKCSQFPLCKWHNISLLKRT